MSVVEIKSPLKQLNYLFPPYALLCTFFCEVAAGDALVTYSSVHSLKTSLLIPHNSNLIAAPQGQSHCFKTSEWSY